MTRSRSWARWLVAASVLVPALAIANARADVTTAASMPETCVFRLEPLGPADDAGVITATPVLVGCYTRASDAFLAGSGNVRIPERLAGSRLSQHVIDRFAGTAAEGVLSDFLIGKEWDDLSYSGAVNEYFASTGCAANTWQVSYVGDAWNDRFQSGKGFSSCDHNRKFEHADFGGAVLLCTSDCSNYGVLNNEVSSLRWKD